MAGCVSALCDHVPLARRGLTRHWPGSQSGSPHRYAGWSAQSASRRQVRCQLPHAGFRPDWPGSAGLAGWRLRWAATPRRCHVPTAEQWMPFPAQEAGEGQGLRSLACQVHRGSRASRPETAGRHRERDKSGLGAGESALLGSTCRGGVWPVGKVGQLGGA